MKKKVADLCADENKSEHVCKIKKHKKPFIFKGYAYYNKKKSFRALAFMHRMVSNIFLRMYLKCAHRVKVEGKEHIKQLKKKGFVVVSNHIHTMDIQMISTFVFGLRRVHWLTLSRNFDLNVRFFIRNSGGVPIPDERDDKKICFNQMNDLLKDNGVLHICPEGSLVDMCGEIRPFKVGAFRFAAQNNVPLLPITLRFDEFSKKGKKYKKPHFVIDIAEPIYVDASALYPADELMERTRQVMMQKCNVAIK